MKALKNIKIFLLLLVATTSSIIALFLTSGQSLERAYLPEVSFAIALIFIVVFTVIFSAILISILNGAFKNADKSIHPEKAIIYKQFIDNCYDNEILSDHPSNSNGLARSMALWASDAVLEQYIILEKMSILPHQKDNNAAQQMEKVILEMRRDLGQKNFGIQKGSIHYFLKKTYLTNNQKT